MSELETRYACNNSTVEFSDKGEGMICPRCGQPMQQDKATGEWICTHCI